MVGYPSAVPALLLGLAVTLAGCDSSSSGSSVERNPGEGSSVRLTPDSFKVQGEHLDWAVYPGFLRAITPSGTDPQAEQVIADIDRVMREFIGSEPALEGESDPVATGEAPRLHRSVRNSVDLITRVLNTDEVENFVAGRASIDRAIDRGEASYYRHADIVFNEPDSEVEDGRQGDSWRYILSMYHVPPAADPEELEEETELAGDIFSRQFEDAVMQMIFAVNAPGSQLSVFPAQQFGAYGQPPRPEARITSFTLSLPADAEEDAIAPAATLNQTWGDGNSDVDLDLWTWASETPARFLEDHTVRCAHLRVDYAREVATFYTSDEARSADLDADDELELARESAATSPEDFQCGHTSDDQPTLEWTIDGSNAALRYPQFSAP